MDIGTVISAGLLSSFLAVTVYCTYGCLRGRVTLDRCGAKSHALVARFASAQELAHFHREHAAALRSAGDAALVIYAREFHAELARHSPARTRVYRTPDTRMHSVDAAQPVVVS